MEMVFQASNNLRLGGPGGKLESVLEVQCRRRCRRQVSLASLRDERDGPGVQVAREREPYRFVVKERSPVEFALPRPGAPDTLLPIPPPSLSLRSKAHPFAPG